MIDLEHLWPDPDRRERAELQALIRVHAQPWPRTDLTETERRALQAVSVGLDVKGAAVVLGLSPHTVATYLRGARRALRAKDTTHAVAEALRQGAIL